MSSSWYYILYTWFEGVAKQGEITQKWDFVLTVVLIDSDILFSRQGAPPPFLGIPILLTLSSISLVLVVTTLQAFGEMPLMAKRCPGPKVLASLAPLYLEIRLLVNPDCYIALGA